MYTLVWDKAICQVLCYDGGCSTQDGNRTKNVMNEVSSEMQGSRAKHMQEQFLTNKNSQM